MFQRPPVPIISAVPLADRAMPDASVSTPLLEQYEGVKARYPGHLILFRVGDFYETFGDDARLLSRELDVVLTARSADAKGVRTPMAGVPHHAVDTYLGRLVQKGFKVALCDQVEDARFAKGLVRREVTRVVTPGTVVEDRILGGPDHSFLAVAGEIESGAGEYAAVDITTGEWYHGTADGPGTEALASALAPFQPREILWSVPADRPSTLSRTLGREYPGARLEAAPSPLTLAELPERFRRGFAGPDAATKVDLQLAAYLRATQPRLLPHLEVVPHGTESRRLALDAKTLRHLEIRRPMNPDDPSGPTLLETWDATVTSPGRRTLSFWLANPLADVGAIQERQDAVAALLARGAFLDELRTRLHTIADLARIASRVAGRRVRPPELGVLRQGLLATEHLGPWLAETPMGVRLDRLRETLLPPPELLELLGSALPDSLPLRDDDGGRFRAGHAPEVDRWRTLEQTALTELATLERAEQQATGIKTLRISYNQVFGYYIEVTRPHLARVPSHFRRRQTVAQAERFTSDQLEEIEHRILDARRHASEAEELEWERLLAAVDTHVPAIHRVARAVGELDVLATFAHLAQTRGYVRPVVDDSSVLLIREGRHPVLERADAPPFVPNDTELDAEHGRLVVLTGPNMSGKSTYMRQVGLLVVLAQAGSFVPARFARIGLVNRLFTRMGFTDEIGRGKSSFMVEMSEVAEILHAADAKSLVLLDEVGRGTSTFDGLALAWATVRHLHERTGARCLLATHYHQLTELVGSLPQARNAHLAVREGPDGIVFLHRLVPGSTDRSYGIHVARLAGVPEDVLVEAERLLRQLEEEGIVTAAPSRRSGRPTPRYTQAVLLAETDRPRDPVLQALEDVDPDSLTAEEAQRRLRELRELARRSSFSLRGDP
ncbi:MAG: DNA mismatch repair protein MutS [Thermoplasmata archaeon]|nr:DNA mismatch repair protein MutS [Thermoplasmata archaeon]